MIITIPIYEKSKKSNFLQFFLLALLLCSTSVISLPQPKDSNEIEKLDDFDWKDFNLTPESPVKDVSDDIEIVPTVEIEQPEVLSPDPVSVPQEQIQEERSFQEPIQEESAPQESAPKDPVSAPQEQIQEERSFQEPIQEESAPQESAPQEPVSVLQEPVSIPQEPVSVTQEPVSVPQEPVSVPPISVPQVSTLEQQKFLQLPLEQQNFAEAVGSPSTSLESQSDSSSSTALPSGEVGSFSSLAPSSNDELVQPGRPSNNAERVVKNPTAPSSLSMNTIIGIIGVVVIFIFLSIYLIYKRYERNLDHDRNQSEIDFSSGKKLSTFSENDGDNKKYEANSRYSQNSLYSQNNYLKSSFGKNDDGDDNVSISSSLQSKALIPPNFTSSPLSSISGTAVQQESNDFSKGQLDSSIGQKEIKSIENRNSSLLSGPSLSIKNDFDLRDSLPSVSTGSSELGSHYRDSLASDNEMISKGHHTSYLPADFLSDEHFHDLANFNFAMMNPKESPRPPSVPTITAPSGPKSSATSTNTGLLGNPVYDPAAAFSQPIFSSTIAKPNTTVKSNTNETIEPILLKKVQTPPKVKKTMGSVLQPSPLRNPLA